MHDLVTVAVAGEVANALATSRPVVALESSVIAQGLPQPRNLEAALACEETVRQEGVTPATTAIVRGVARVGLERAELEMLAGSDGIQKAGARDLAVGMATGATMATTVGATIALAAATGVKVMATGGIGGVHAGYEQHLDVSNDLIALASEPVVVISSGFKSILDIARTLEYLETLGVPVTGFQTRELPNFYTSTSGFEVPCLPDEAAVAATYRAQRALGSNSGLIVTNPPPSQAAFSDRQLSEFVSAALRDAESDRVSGKRLTPYLLGRIAALSAGASVDLNVALLLANVRLAARIAAALAGAFE